MTPGFDRVRDLMREAVGRVFPGAVLLVAAGGEVRFEQGFGVTALPGLSGPSNPVGPDTVFDLASLTKPLVTASLAMRLVAAGRIHLDAPVERYLPEGLSTGRPERSIRSLLLHCSGLPAWRPFAAESVASVGESIGGDPEAREAMARRIAAETDAYPPWTACVYSDLGFLLLGWAVEHLHARPLDEVFAEELAVPLKLKRTGFIRVRSGRAMPSPWPIDEVAATERCPTRGRVLRAEVHDDNAWLLGGVAGHAGLFSTARETWTILQALRRAWTGEDPGLFNPEVVRAFWSTARTPAGHTWAHGFDTPSPTSSSAGNLHPPGLVGHLGFTGTSFWMQPKTGDAVILLTNRVHPSRANLAIREFRPRLHDAVWEAIRT